MTGLFASGKSTAAKMFSKQLDAPVFSLAGEVRKEGGKAGLEPSVENLRRLANDFRERFGAGVWAERAVKGMQASGSEWVVAESIRSPAEVSVLRKFFGKNFFLIEVRAPLAARFERFRQTARGREFSSLGEFKAAEDKQVKGPELSQSIQDAAARADFVIDNSGTVDDLGARVKSLAARLKPAK
ncbi:MAG: hypothetical protein NTY90_02615 [Candidatus Micrarchaeota archaeon]|nr:hypothetical protein [Candidatus Micrarchaeota archaeon]